MAEVKIYHNPLSERDRLYDKDNQLLNRPALKDCELVATVEVPEDADINWQLEIAFERTNTIKTQWWHNDYVTSHFSNPKGCRSTSVGDFAVISDKVYICENVGWNII
jgi:hypothetical protein